MGKESNVISMKEMTYENQIDEFLLFLQSLDRELVSFLLDKDMTVEERKSFIKHLGRSLTENPPTTLEEEEIEQRVRFIFEKFGWDF